MFTSALGSLVGLAVWKYLGVLLFGYLAYFYWTVWRMKRLMPPGPWPIPLLGNILMLRGVPVSTQEYLIELSRRYGDPFTFWFGAKTPAVVCCSKATVRHALVDQQAKTAGRLQSPIFELMLRGSQDIAFAPYNDVWKAHRKLAGRSLRRIVDGAELERRVTEAVDQTARCLLKANTDGQQSVVMADYIANTVFNVICSFCYGKTYAIDDTEFRWLVKLNKEMNVAFQSVFVYEVLPSWLLHHIARWLPGLPKVLNLSGKMFEFVKQQLRQHRETYEEGVTRNFIDTLIAEQNELRKDGDTEVENLTDDHLCWLILDFFSAGTDTTSATLGWFFQIMIMKPDVQDKCAHEIQQVVGHRNATLEDRRSLPYCEAVMMEVLRLRMPAPLSLPHAANLDATVGPYTIPKGAQIFPNLYAMHIHPDGDFGDGADEFDPEKHFLRKDDDGKTVCVKPQGFMPFGGGRRVCLGEQLARNDLFLVSVQLLQRLRFLPADAYRYSLDQDPALDMSFIPLPYPVHVTPRQ